MLDKIIQRTIIILIIIIIAGGFLFLCVKP